MESFLGRGESRQASRPRVRITEPPVNSRYRPSSRKTKACFCVDYSLQRQQSEEDISHPWDEIGPRRDRGDYFPTAHVQTSRYERWIYGYDQRARPRSTNSEYLPIEYNLNNMTNNRQNTRPRAIEAPNDNQQEEWYSNANHFLHTNQHQRPKEFINSGYKQINRRAELNDRNPRSLSPPIHFIPNKHPQTQNNVDFDFPQRKFKQTHTQKKLN